MKAAWMEAMKEWWEKVPKDQKNSKAITALKTPTKPKGMEWSDLEEWWNQLTDEENGEAVRDLMSAFSPIPCGGAAHVGAKTCEGNHRVGQPHHCGRSVPAVQKYPARLVKRRYAKINGIL